MSFQKLYQQRYCVRVITELDAFITDSNDSSVVIIIDLKHMRSNTYPVHPKQRPSHYDLHAINSLLNRYHSPLLIELDDLISFQSSACTLKRYYGAHEFQGKITALSEYYQYHQELPRLFMAEVAPIVKDHQDQMRAYQYAMVGKIMKSDEPTADKNCGSINSARPFTKLIKNVELSYYNFEKKNVKKKGKLLKNKSEGKLAQVKSLQKCKLSSSKMVLSSKLRADSKKAMIPSSKQTKRHSANSSLSSSIKNHNLSRSKSKSNLISFPSKSKLSALPAKEIIVLGEQPKSNKAVHPLKKTEHTTSKTKLQPKGDAHKQNGLKGMFRKALQSKKMK